jgi:hypothetical protein
MHARYPCINSICAAGAHTSERADESVRCARTYLQADVAAHHRPLLLLFGEHGADGGGAARRDRGDADDVGAAAETRLAVMGPTPPPGFRTPFGLQREQVKPSAAAGYVPVSAARTADDRRDVPGAVDDGDVNRLGSVFVVDVAVVRGSPCTHSEERSQATAANLRLSDTVACSAGPGH